MLMIDEPEMNLHPENQRRLARYFARLVNEGYKVYITTHSDYIVKELNTLIMLYRQREHEKNIMKQYGYAPEELLDPAKVRVYMTQEVESQKFTFVKAEIDAEQGIYLPSFDDTINEMNEIQDRILDYDGEEE
jgi:predicted ATPase